jgi:hypothetical protein
MKRKNFELKNIRKLLKNNSLVLSQFHIDQRMIIVIFLK